VREIDAAAASAGVDRVLCLVRPKPNDVV
jgi:hypothetical protein